MLKSGAKNALFGYFWAGIPQSYCHIWKQHLRICHIAKLREKTKIPKFWNKNALLSIFGLEFWNNYGYIWNQHPQICLTEKFCEKIKMLKFGTKNILFGYFRARVLKNYCHIWNQHPHICQKWIFNSYSEFWCRDLRSAFSEGLGSGPDLLYKVCLLITDFFLREYYLQ